MNHQLLDAQAFASAFTILFSGQLRRTPAHWGEFMRISDIYIGKQVFLGTLYAVLVLGLVLVLGNLFKQVQPLLVEQKAPISLVLRFVLTVLPLSLMFTVPWGFLSAVLLVFSRMSSDREITAFRVAGISLVRLSIPVFVLGVFFSLVSLWINITVVPVCKGSSIELLYEQARRDPDSLLKPGLVQANLKKTGNDVKKLFIESKNGEWVEGFHFYQLPQEADDQTYVHAAKAALVVDEQRSQLRVKLEDAYFETRKPDGRVEMAFAGEAEPLLIDLRSPKYTKTRPSTMNNEEIRNEVAHNPTLTPLKKVQFRSEITRRYVFSMACFSFAFIAVPLGLSKQRRETSGGLVISLLIGTGYFLITMMADQFKTDAGVTTMLWLPNVLCILLGLVLFRLGQIQVIRHG